MQVIVSIHISTAPWHGNLLSVRLKIEVAGAANHMHLAEAALHHRLEHRTTIGK